MSKYEISEEKIPGQIPDQAVANFGATNNFLI
jgi:hypothetical protein